MILADVTISAFLESLGAVAAHPLALVGYVAVVIAWMFVVHQRGRLQTLSRMLRDIPEAERARLIERELSVSPRAGLSAADWLKYRGRNLLFLAFVATLVVIVLIAALALYRSGGGRLAKADLALRVTPATLESNSVTASKLTAVVENVGTTIAEDVALQLEIGPGVRILGNFQSPTVHLPSLPGHIATQAEWDIEVNPFEASEVRVRVSARNSDAQYARVPLRGVERRAFQDEVLEFEAIDICAVPGNGLAVLTPSGIAVLRESGSRQMVLLPAECSSATAMMFDSKRDAIWVVCEGSQQLVAVRTNGKGPLPVPAFPTLVDSGGTPFSRTPGSVAITPRYIACAAKNTEQCLWMLDWSTDDLTDDSTWRAVEYPDELKWTDCDVAWTGGTLAMLHANVIPASLTYYNNNSANGEQFRTLSGHNYDTVSGVTSILSIPDSEDLLADEYGEHLMVLGPDGRRKARAALTKEESWSTGLRKTTLLAIDAPGNVVLAAVNRLDGSVDCTTTLFATSLNRLDAIRSLGAWADCRVLGLAVVDDKAIALCQTKAEGRTRKVIRRIPLS